MRTPRSGWRAWHGACVSLSYHPTIDEETKMNKPESKQIRPVMFVLRKLHRGCWVVACDGRWIAGAVLSSLPAAAAYAGEIAAASGWQNFLLTVVSR
jgi:hypothetical protein